MELSSAKTYFITAILILVGVAVIAWSLYPRPVVFYEDFERGFGEWVKNADVPQDPNNPGNFVAWDVSRVSSQAHSGEYSMEMYVDGRQDDGTVWMERKLTVNPNSQIQVEVSFEFYSEQSNFNIIAGVCAYVGISYPQTEEDFLVLGQANEVAGWKRYTYKTSLQTSSVEEICVAVGITVRWETEMTYNLDDVTVTIN